MTDRPIIFSGPMVRALIDGRKTMTRRVLKPQPLSDGYYEGRLSLDRVTSGYARFSATAIGGGAIREHVISLPYVSGDRMWVREAHALLPRTAYRMSIGTGTIDQREHPTDGYTAAVFREGFDRSGPLRWRPSIHMPRWASRLTLTLTEVRVQRVQEISQIDAFAEGIEHDAETATGGCFHPGNTEAFDDPVSAFRNLWDSLNATRGYGWESNPWICAISFDVTRQNIDQMGETT